MNTGTKILKTLANQIQQHIKRIMHRDHIGFILGTQGWFSIEKSLNIPSLDIGQKTYNHLNRYRKTFDKF